MLLVHCGAKHSFCELSQYTNDSRKPEYFFILYFYRVTNNGMRVQCVRNTRKIRQSSVHGRNAVRERSPISVGMPIIVKRNVRRRVPEIVTIIRRVVPIFVLVVAQDPELAGQIALRARI